MFTSSQIKTTKQPNTFTVQEAGIYSNAEPNQFWNKILFSKHSATTLQSLAKDSIYSVISTNTLEYSDSHLFQTKPYNTLRFELFDKFLN